MPFAGRGVLDEKFPSTLVVTSISTQQQFDLEIPLLPDSEG